MEKIDINKYRFKINVDEEKIKGEMNRLINRELKWVEIQEVSEGDIVVCKITSNLSKFNKENINISIGSGLYDSTLEKALIGAKVGETKSIQVDGEEILALLKSVRHKVIPEISDEMVKSLGIEGVNTIEDYRNYLISVQKEEQINNISYELHKCIKEEMFKNSKFDLYEEDFKKICDLELERCAALAAKEGLDIKTMKEEDFNIRIPVKSYAELVELTSENSREKLIEYVIGKHYADVDKYTITKEDYDEFIKEYADFWQVIKEYAIDVNQYEHYVICEIIGYYYKKIRLYIEEKIG